MRQDKHPIYKLREQHSYIINNIESVTHFSRFTCFLQAGLKPVSTVSAPNGNLAHQKCIRAKKIGLSYKAFKCMTKRKAF